jgi:hypothetical protein
MISKLDDDGNVLWSNIIEIWVTDKPYTIKNKLNISINKSDEVVLTYGDRATIKVYSFKSRNGNLNIKRERHIETENEGDRIKWTRSGSVEPWYGSVYLMSGVQKVKNKSALDKKRQVKFFSRVEM